MSDFRSRLKKEHKQLDKKLTKLVEFNQSDEFATLSEEMQRLLSIQETIMAAYSNVLVARLDYL